MSNYGIRSNWGDVKPPSAHKGIWGDHHDEMMRMARSMADVLDVTLPPDFGTNEEATNRVLLQIAWQIRDQMTAVLARGGTVPTADQQMVHAVEQVALQACMQDALAVQVIAALDNRVSSGDHFLSFLRGKQSGTQKKTKKWG